jgi:hypothetical protein
MRTVWAGVLLFLVAIPADLLYHRWRGIDLTSWSLPHSLLYIGTVLMIVGTLAGYLKDHKEDKSLLAKLLPLLFCLLLMEDVLFPLVQQEFGAMSLHLFKLGLPFADADLMKVVTDPFKQTYGGLPLALYPVYVVGGYLFCMRFTRKMVPHRWSATIITSAYLAFRAVSWLGMNAMDFPVSFIPYFTLLMALTVDLAANARQGWINHAVTGVVAAGLAYGAAIYWQNLTIMPIWPSESIWMGVLAGFAGLMLADWAAEKLRQPDAITTPLMELRRQGVG